MKAQDRFIRYIHYNTASDEECPDCPSSQGQMVLARALVEEMKEMGIGDARVDEHGYVYGSIPANTDGQPGIGLIAHMDTVSSVAVEPMRERIVKDYDGGKITLDNGDVIGPDVYEGMKAFIGGDLIVTDGNTILGADDKAGVAEILTACERVMKENVPHGKICIGFTPDEEIGRGADLFDVAGFGAEFAYTVDGGPLPEVEYENFNAASAKVTVKGLAIHPGSAKNKMINSQLVAMELVGMLPADQRPEHTEGYEGFFHLTGMKGSEEKTEMGFIIRDHDRAKFEKKKEVMRAAAEYLNHKYPEGTVEVTITDSYYNMKEKLEGRMDIVERAFDAIRKVGYEPVAAPIRGGTDGARLSYMGLPCPNLPTGGLNCHGRHETLSIKHMDKCVDMIVEIVRAR